MVAIIKRGLSPLKIKKVLKKIEKNKKTFNASKYCGIIKLKEDALTAQKKLRNEWN